MSQLLAAFYLLRAQEGVFHALNHGVDAFQALILGFEVSRFSFICCGLCAFLIVNMLGADICFGHSFHLWLDRLYGCLYIIDSNHFYSGSIAEEKECRL